MEDDVIPNYEFSDKAIGNKEVGINVDVVGLDMKLDSTKDGNFFVLGSYNFLGTNRGRRDLVRKEA